MTSTLQALLAETSFDFDGTWLARCQQRLLQLLLLPLLCLRHRWVAALHFGASRSLVKQKVVQCSRLFSLAIPVADCVAVRSRPQLVLRPL